MKKRILAAAVFLLTGFSSLFATTFFSGETGVAANFSNKVARSFEPELVLNGFLAGQLTVSDALSFRGEFSLQSGDMYENGFMKDSENSVFRINEFSTTFAKSFGGALHTLSLFWGLFETMGSQKFITRRLGVMEYKSLLTENYLGQKGDSFHDIYGFGGSYSLTLRTLPVSMGIIAYKNSDGQAKAWNETTGTYDSDNFVSVEQFNIDLRFATAFRYLTMDMAVGIGAPLYDYVQKQDSDGNIINEKVFLLIDTLYIRMGIDVLLGNKYSPFSIYLKNGFDFLPFPNRSAKSAKDFDLHDVYLLVEPRFNFGTLKLHLSAFNIPTEQLKKIPYLLEDETVGVNFNFFSDTLRTTKRDYSAGVNFTVSFSNKYINDLEDSDIFDNMNIKIAPFANIHAMDGIVSLMLQTSVTKFAHSEPEAVKFTIGYKKEL